MNSFMARLPTRTVPSKNSSSIIFQVQSIGALLKLFFPTQSRILCLSVLRLTMRNGSLLKNWKLMTFFKIYFKTISLMKRFMEKILQTSVTFIQLSHKEKRSYRQGLWHRIFQVLRSHKLSKVSKTIVKSYKRSYR